MKRVELQWELGKGESPSEWFAATVPGAVQLDWAAHSGWGPHWYADNFKQYDGLEDEAWVYRTVLPATPGQVIFICKGIDYAYEIALDGEFLLASKGLFTPVELDLSDRLDEEKTLTIKILPAPKLEGASWGRREASHSTKPTVSYGWDFHPRLIPLGIWDETYLEVCDEASVRIDSAEVRYRLSEDLSEASLHFSCENLGMPCEWRLYDPSGALVLSVGGESDSITAKLDQPQLWWPHDQGEPNLYRVELSVAGVIRELKVGFRRTRLVMHDGAWEWPSDFPKPRSNPPMTLEINGRAIFCKGSNWVAPDIFPGTLTEAKYTAQLQLVKDSNMNLLRMWGGAVIQKDSFYEICDELGIMVWQEFPLACNPYPDTDEYLEELYWQARAILQRLRRNPSVVMWCGGNELFNAWSGMDDQSHALRQLNAMCLELDRFTPFLPTSPVSGVGHGGYTFRDPNSLEECWSIFQKSANTAYTEFGCGGIASAEVLRSFIPEDQLFPPRPGTVWEDHHAFGAWQGDTWLDLATIEHYFGESTSLEELVKKGQLLQAEGFRGLFEEARRQKPICSMALNWCLNEPWPTAANNSLISWPCEPKPALSAVAQACRPTLASARITKFSWEEGEWFDPELWLLHDAPNPMKAGTMVARVGGTVLLKWEFAEVEANKNLRGPKAAFKLPRFEGPTFTLEVSVEGRPELSTTYTLAYKAKVVVHQGERGLNQ